MLQKNNMRAQTILAFLHVGWDLVKGCWCFEGLTCLTHLLKEWQTSFCIIFLHSRNSFVPSASFIRQKDSAFKTYETDLPNNHVNLCQLLPFFWRKMPSPSRSEKHGKTRIMPPLADHLPSHCCVLPSLQEIKNQHVTCTWSVFHGWIFVMDPFRGVSMIMISDIPHLFGGNYPHCQLGIHTNPANLLVAAGLPRQTSPTQALRQNWPSLLKRQVVGRLHPRSLLVGGFNPSKKK